MISENKDKQRNKVKNNNQATTNNNDDDDDDDNNDNNNNNIKRASFPVLWTVSDKCREQSRFSVQKRQSKVRARRQRLSALRTITSSVSPG